MQVTVRSPVYPTEAREHVETALSNLFALDPPFNEEEDHLVIILPKKRNSLDVVRQRIHAFRIIDAVRSKLLSNWDGRETTICFDKQAAYHGKLRLIDDRQEDPPLGSIEVLIEFEQETEFNEFLAWFTPPTKNGNIISG